MEVETKWYHILWYMWVGVASAVTILAMAAAVWDVVTGKRPWRADDEDDEDDWWKHGDQSRL